MHVLINAEAVKRFLPIKSQKTLAFDVVKSAKDLPVKIVVLSDDYMYYSETSDYIENYKKVKSVQLKQVNDIAEEINKGVVDALKMNIICEGVSASDYVKYFSERYDGRLIVNSGGLHLVELINPSASKGEAVKFLSKYYKIPLKNNSGRRFN